MSLTDALLLQPHPFDIWIAKRTDGIKGSGTGTGNLSIAVTVVRGESVLVDGNVINLLSNFPHNAPNFDDKDYRMREVAAKDGDFRHNTTASGDVIPALNTNGAFIAPGSLVTPVPDAYDDVVSKVSDGVLVAFL